MSSAHVKTSRQLRFFGLKLLNLEESQLISLKFIYIIQFYFLEKVGADSLSSFESKHAFQDMFEEVIYHTHRIHWSVWAINSGPASRDYIGYTHNPSRFPKPWMDMSVLFILDHHNCRIQQDLGKNLGIVYV